MEILFTLLMLILLQAVLGFDNLRLSHRPVRRIGPRREVWWEALNRGPSPSGRDGT